MKPTIRTSELSASWMTAGINPSSFEKSITQTKNPAGRAGLHVVLGSSVSTLNHAQLRRRRPRWLMMMHVMVAGEHRKKSLPDAIGAVKLNGSLNTIERVASVAAWTRTSPPLVLY